MKICFPQCWKLVITLTTNTYKLPTCVLFWIIMKVGGLVGQVMNVYLTLFFCLKTLLRLSREICYSLKLRQSHYNYLMFAIDRPCKYHQSINYSSHNAYSMTLLLQSL